MLMIPPLNLKMLPVALAVAVSSNLDNIAIGTSIGFRRIGLRFRDNAVVASVTTIGTVVSAAAGSALTAIIPDYAESALGGAIMLLVGIWIIYQETIRPHTAEAAGGAAAGVAPAPPQSQMKLPELLMLSLGLSLNNIPNGIGAGMLHIDIWVLGTFNFLASLLTLGLGLRVGRRGITWLGRYAGFVAGMLLAALGAIEMVV